MLVEATPITYFEREPQPGVQPYTPDLSHALDLSSCGLTDEEFADMAAIARATNQWIEDHGGGPQQLHHTSAVDADGKARRNVLGRASDAARRVVRREVKQQLGGAVPAGMVISHLPDTTVSGLAETYLGFALHHALANARVGGRSAPGWRTAAVW